jgi:4-hydroxythreonine-4-phosphate dehydrogenase
MPPIPHLALTLGDPAGIGPEIVLKALADPTILEQSRVTIFGSRSVLEQTYLRLIDQTPHLAHPNNLTLVDIPLPSPITPGVGNSITGAASFSYLQQALQKTLAGEFQALVTAPIAKSCWQKAGYNYPGQTEVLAQAAGVDRYGMLFVGRSPYTGWILRTLLATTHIPLKEVPTALNPLVMTQKLDLLIDFLTRFSKLKHPHIAIAGLNPHSGEEGQLGREEKDWLIPWLEEERTKHPELELSGPIPPDTLWVKAGMAWYQGNINPADAYLALYHDQGLIPVKLMAFDQAINTTIGLPFIRTSPDHGTAFDIAGQGIARATSMTEAIKLAAQLVKN